MYNAQRALHPAIWKLVGLGTIEHPISSQVFVSFGQIARWRAAAHLRATACRATLTMSVDGAKADLELGRCPKLRQYNPTGKSVRKPVHPFAQKYSA